MPKVRVSGARAPRFLFKKVTDEAPAKKGKWYPTEDEPKPRSRKFTPGVAKLRSSLTPGTVVILLSGRFKGKRAVFLKQLESGLLLVSGPYNVNGVPLRRVNQAYVIATSHKVNVSGVAVPASVNDKYFSAEKTALKQGKEAFEALKAAKPALPEEKKKIQADLDARIVLSAEEKAYLKSTFSLSKGDKPHEMKF